MIRVLEKPPVMVLLAFATSIVLALSLLWFLGVDPRAAIEVTLQSNFGSWQGFADSLVYATPRLFVALGAIVALRAGQINLGGEGQLQFGAIGAAVGGVVLASHLPAPLVVPMCLVLAILFGALWAGIAGLIKVRRGSSEIITTLLMNFIALFFVQLLVQGPLQAPNTTYNSSSRIAASAELPSINGTRLHFGFVVALATAFFVWAFMERTSLGLRLRAVGANATAASFQGIGVKRLIVIAMCVSGGIAGLAGASEVLGVQFRLIQGFSPGFGFEGLAIAFLAGLRPVPAIAISVFFGAIYNAATQLQQTLGVTASAAFFVEGLPIVLLACASGLVVLRRSVGRT